MHCLDFTFPSRKGQGSFEISLQFELGKFSLSFMQYEQRGASSRAQQRAGVLDTCAGSSQPWLRILRDDGERFCAIWRALWERLSDASCVGAFPLVLQLTSGHLEPLGLVSGVETTESRTAILSRSPATSPFFLSIAIVDLFGATSQGRACNQGGIDEMDGQRITILRGSDLPRCTFAPICNCCHNHKLAGYPPVIDD
jgi:hypothetical protein